MTNTGLDQLIAEILRQTPGSGETYVPGIFREGGIKVHSWRVRECLRIVDPVGRALTGRRAIQQRVYNVPKSSVVVCMCFFYINLININSDSGVVRLPIEIQFQLLRSENIKISLGYENSKYLLTFI